MNFQMAIKPALIALVLSMSPASMNFALGQSGPGPVNCLESGAQTKAYAYETVQGPVTPEVRTRTCADGSTVTEQWDRQTTTVWQTVTTIKERVPANRCPPITVVGDQTVFDQYDVTAISGPPAFCPEDSECCVLVSTDSSFTDVTKTDPPTYRFVECPYDSNKQLKIKTVLTHTTRTTTTTLQFQAIGVDCEEGEVCEDFVSTVTTEFPILSSETSLFLCEDL